MLTQKNSKHSPCTRLRLESIFSKDSWRYKNKGSLNKLQEEFQGSERVGSAKLVTLKRKVEMLRRNENEAAKAYSAKLMALKQQEDNLFMAIHAFQSSEKHSWFTNNGCTTHLDKDAVFFKTLDTSIKTTVKLGNGED
ncbi:hypothetical protein Nepgr_030444 [Nepenthes gracilis]|uniref:Uncharacterized protein n=1 Tax=Nepenthes gracilis TaxID=150966 RepID=A0AAD3TG81_NEPGR|nr:hypothetical protein Nepgr_030444 [Nepenthes gracilis]